MSSTGRLIQLKTLDQVPLYPRIKTSNVINDAHFIGVSDSGEVGQILTKTASGPRWVTPAPSGQSAIVTTANYLEITQSDVQDEIFTFSSDKLPISLQAPSGNYYTVQSRSVYVQQQSISLDLSPYLAYQDMQVFQGTWKLYVLPALSTDIISILDELSDSITDIRSSLQNYYTKSQVDALIGNSSDSYDFSNYYTKAQTDILLSSKQSLSDALQIKASFEQQFGAFSNSLTVIKDTFSNYYIKSEIEQIAKDLSNSFNEKLEGYYTKGQVDELLQELSTSIDLSSYYTKNQTDILLQKKYDASDAQQLSITITALQNSRIKLVVLSNPSDDICTLQGMAVVFAVIDNNNNYWPVELQSVSYSSGNTLLDLSPYLVYGNQASFTGTWKAVAAFIN